METTSPLQTGLSDNDRFLRSAFNRQLLPAILSVGGVLAGNMANSLIAGNLLGHEALAIMSVAAPIYSIFATIGSLAGVGGSSVAAWCVGRNDQEGSDRAFTFSALLCLGISLICVLAGLLLPDPLLTLLGAGELHELARPYVLVYIVGGLGVAGIYPPYFFLKLEGRLKLSVTLFVCLAALNIGLDFFFVLAADMGVTGIALGTAVSNIAAAIAGWVCLLARKGSFRLRSPGKHWRDALRLTAAGSPAAMNNLCNVLRSIALNQIINGLAGSIGLSAFSIVTTAYNLSLTVINGLCQTTVPFIGVFSSERDAASIRQLEKRAAWEGTALILPVSLLLIFFSRPFCALFGLSDSTVLATAAPAVALFAVSLLPAMLSTILVNYYQACGLTWLANLFTVCRALVMVVLSALILSPILAVQGVWLGFTLAELLSWAVMAAALYLYRKKQPQRQGLLLLDRRCEAEGRFISFSVHSSVEDIMDASQRISEFCESNELDARRSMLISLSLEEMLISIKDHCFPDDDSRDISIRILILDEGREDSSVVLRIRCSGAPFNPIAYYEAHKDSSTEPPPIPAEPETGEPDGLGLDGLELELAGLDALEDSLGIAMIVSTARMVDYKSTFGANNLTILL